MNIPSWLRKLLNPKSINKRPDKRTAWEDFGDESIIKEVMPDQLKRYSPAEASKVGVDAFRRSLEWKEVMTTGEVEEVLEKTGISKPRLIAFVILVFVVFMITLGRLVSLQVISGSKYLSASFTNQLRIEVTRAARGVIYDRNNKILASSIPGFRLGIDTSNLSDSDVEKSVEVLSKLLKEDKADIEKIISERSVSPTVNIADIDHDLAINIESRSNEIPGVFVEVNPIRFYQDPKVFAHLLGYTGEVTKEELETDKYRNFKPGDRIGKVGVEELYESLLHGSDGQDLVSVEASGKKTKLFGVVPPKNGENLTLSIDYGLQKVLYEELEKTMKDLSSTGAAAVAIDPRTGELLALVSLPSFDNNLFAQGIKQKEYTRLISSKDNPLLNRGVSSAYPPASTFKIVNATAGLSEKVIEPDTKLEAPSAIDLGGGAVFKDWKDHGVINVMRALAESSDTFFYKVGGGHGSQLGLGPERLAKWARLFGFGRPTGIGLKNEVSGLVPDPQWKKDTLGEDWYLGNTYNFSIGQGDMLTTPIQLANATASVAGGGKLFSPTLIKGAKAEIIREGFVSSKVLQVVKEGMKEATLAGGTAWPLRGFKVQTAAKTGTGEATGKETKPYGWFTSFAPFDDPNIAISVVIENAGEGSNTAGPVVKKAYDYWFREQLTKK